MTIAFAIMTLALAAMNLYLVRRIQDDVGKIEDHEEEIGAAFVGLTNAGQQIRDLELRMTKVEQIATNAQNKATANQKRIEKGIIYETEHTG